MIHKTKLTHNYLELLKKSLVNELYIENEARIILALSAIFQNTELTLQDMFNIKAHDYIFNMLEANKQNGSHLVLCKKNKDGVLENESSTRNVTELSHTMIGTKRLNNLQYCIETILDDDVPGDLIETGIWRGGATIFMRGVLAAYGNTDRIVWAADSFEGVPIPTLPEDAKLDLSANVLPILSVSLDEVMDLFERYD